MAAPEPPFIRFQKGYTVSPDTQCWLWGGAKYRNGYGWIKAFGNVVSAHRFSYELHKGPIPDGMHILHSCDVRHCVNPDHLRAGSHAENMAEAAERGRMRSGINHPNFGKSPKRPKQAIAVRVLGKEYESINASERALGLGGGTVRYWLNKGDVRAQVIKKGDAGVICE
jgi:hypothetical protein